MTLLIYLKCKRGPFEIEFKSLEKYNNFLTALLSNETQIIEVGPIIFAKSEFAYCLQK